MNNASDIPPERHCFYTRLHEVDSLVHSSASRTIVMDDLALCMQDS